jgi:hypothetical protein
MYAAPEIRNPNIEIRNKFEIRMTETSKTQMVSNFEFRASDLPVETGCIFSMPAMPQSEGF